MNDELLKSISSCNNSETIKLKNDLDIEIGGKDEFSFNNGNMAGNSQSVKRNSQGVLNLKVSPKRKNTQSS